MVYDMTEKLRFDEDPVLIVKDARLTVRSDAETVLTLVDALRDKDETAGAREAAALLFSDEDRKKLAALRLRMDDHLRVVAAAVRLALGGDPEEEDTPGE